MSGDLNSDHLQQLYISTLFIGKKRQQPLLTVHAHVFHINPETKKSWVPVTESAVPVSFYYDVTRNMYRIIGLDGAKAVVNSTMSPIMNFTKTSQKFGQWTDTKTSVVYGMGFTSESDLEKFQDQFDELKEALRLSVSSPSKTNTLNKINANGIGNSIMKQDSEPASSTDVNANSIYHLRRNGLPLQCTTGSPCKVRLDSPKRIGYTDSGTHISEAQQQLKQENEKLRMALQQSSSNAKMWEVELNNLKTNNLYLTSRLQECSQTVEEWKSQLDFYKEENQQLKIQINEAETAGKDQINKELIEEIENLRCEIESYNKQLGDKEEAIKILNNTIAENSSAKESAARLQAALHRLKTDHDVSTELNDEKKRMIQELNSQLGDKIAELNELQQKIFKLL